MDRFRSPQNAGQEGSNQASDLSQKPQMPHPVVPDVKPRLTKEQHDILEAHFQQQNKPSTNTKKGFADALGVPLDKINNWFQNRRAKVKQDLKKQMSAYNLYHQQLTGHIPPGPPPVIIPPPQTQPMNPPEYFVAMPQDVSPSRQPLDPHAGTPQALGVGMQPQFAMQHHDFTNQSLGSISESAQQGSYKDVVASLMAAGYNLPAGNGDGTSTDFLFQMDQNSMGPAFSDDINLALASAMPMGADGFVDDSALGQFADFSSYEFGSFPNASSTSMQAMQSHDSMSSKPSTNYAQSTAPSLSASAGHASSSTSMYSPWTDDQGDAFDPNREEFVEPKSAIAGNLAAATSTSSLPLWAANPHPAQYHSFYQQQNSSSTSQTLLFSPSEGPGSRQLHSSGSDLEPPPVFGEDIYARRNSSTSNLAETFNKQIGIRSQSAVDLSYKQPSAPQCIAARRQRHPAALGQAALRSASFTSGMPSSPGANPAIGPDQSLRRIRSSGFSNGRVQKSSAPRSPMSLNFAEAAASPKFAKQTMHGNNGGTAVSTPGGSISNANLAPPTPMTPNESGGHFPMWQIHGNMKTEPLPDGNSPPDSLGFSWSGEQSSSGAISTAGSPMKAPLDASAINQARLHSAAVFKDTPPQSAPATQVTFPRPPFVVAPQLVPEPSGPREYYGPPQSKLSHFRSPSVPDATNSNAASATAMMDPMMQFGDGGSSGDMQMAYVMQLRRNLANGGLPSEYMQMMAHNAGAISSAVTMPGSTVSAMPDLYVHEYVPPNAAGQKQPQPQQHSPQQRAMDNAPKNYVFANHGPKDFKE